MANFLKEVNLKDLRENNLKLMFGLGTIIYIAFGFLLDLSSSSYHDPIWLRLSILFFSVTSITVTISAQKFKRHLVKVLFTNLYLYNAHLFYLLFLNDFDATYKLTLLVVNFASILFIQDKKINQVYLIANSVTYTLVLFVVESFSVESFSLGFLIFMTLLIGYLTNLERIKAFAQLKERETLLRSINDNVFHGIFRIGKDDEIIYANENFSTMLGYGSVGELLNTKKPLKIKNKEVARNINLRKRDLEVIKNEEIELIGRDGTSLWVLLSLSPFKNEEGHLKYFDGAIIDITARKNAEKELMLFSAAIDHSTTSVMITDRNGSIRYVNPFFTRLTNYTFDEIIGKKSNELIIKDPNAKTMWKELAEGNVWKGELTHTNKSGEHIIALTSVAPIWDNTGDVINYVIISEDITDRKQTEKELVIAKNKAEIANHTQEQFLSTVSHELRTPMNAVIGITNLLIEEEPKSDQIENLNILRYSANNLMALINDVLDLSKIEAGKLDIVKEDFDLGQLLNSIKTSHRMRASQKSVELNVNIDDKLPPVLIGDITRLNQILNNLVSNAVKFTDEGKVEINVKLKKLNKTIADVEFNVTDSGIGIPADKLEEIFESFSQASIYTNKLYGGTGLGLAITRRLIELQGGSISVKSKINKGSSFIFNLKMQVSKKQELPSDVIITRNFSGLSGVHILLVEDNKVNQKVAAKFLKKWDATIDFADNGKEALEKIKTNEYSIVLMDLQMPEMDGCEATKAVRKIDKYKDLPIVALTASAMSHEREKAFEAGVNDYVTKPFVPTELYNKITKYAYVLDRVTKVS